MPPPSFPRSPSVRSLAAPPILSTSADSPSPSPSSASSSTATRSSQRREGGKGRNARVARPNDAAVLTGKAARGRGKGKERAEDEEEGEEKGEEDSGSSEEGEEEDTSDEEEEDEAQPAEEEAEDTAVVESHSRRDGVEEVEPPDPDAGAFSSSGPVEASVDGVESDGDGGEEEEEEEEEEEGGSAEEEEDSREEEEDEDEDEDEDDEPTLKYARLGGSTAEVLGKETASAVAVCSKYIVIGTHNGAVFVLTPEGRLVKRFQPHSATVMDLSVDIASEFVASASMDGRVAIHSLSPTRDSEPPQIFDLGRPLRCVALDPYFAKRTTRQFVSGGMAGALVLSEKGWLGQKEVTLYSGEGPICAAEWKGTFIAWASDAGVRIYDTTSSQRITYISRAEDSPRADLYKCTLHWQDDRTLLIGWADFIKVAVIKERETKRSVPGVSSVVGAGTELYVEVTAIFQVDCMVSGLAPYGDKGDLLVLAYLEEEEDADEATEDRDAQRRKEGIMPELRIISSEGEELSSDAIALKNYDRFQCRDYSLVPTADGTAFLVVAPMDVVVVQTRDEEDHVVWLIEQKRYEEALKALEKTGKAQAGGFDVTDVGKKYLEFLVDDGQYEKAAAACPQLLNFNAKLWEDWVFLFAEKGQLKTIIPYVPTHDPQLSRLVYEMIIAHFLRHDQAALLRTIKAWSPEIYDVQAVILAIKDYLERSPKSTLLLQAISEVYIIARQPGKAVPYLISLRDPRVFTLIREHNLFTDVQDQALLLIEFDEDLRKQRSALEKEKEPTHGTAIGLLVDHTHSIPVPRVVSQLQDQRKYLYMYLDALFDKDAHLAFDYSDLQVDLYAEYNPTKLMEFLRASNYYSLERAYKICDARDLVPEMVFLLGRMGDNKRALNLIIERLGDVERAIEFAKEQNDNDLWEDLLRYSETKPRFIRGLLENVGAEIDPIRLIRRIQNGLEIPGLKPALIKILQDFQLQISLMEGCKSILFTDCRHLALALQDSQTKGFLWTGETADKVTGEPVFPHLTGGAVPAALPFAVRFLSGSTYTSTSAFPSLAPSSTDSPSLSAFSIPTFTKRDTLVAAALLASSGIVAGGGGGGEDVDDPFREKRDEMESKLEGVRELRGILKEERRKAKRREARAEAGEGGEA